MGNCRSRESSQHTPRRPATEGTERQWSDRGPNSNSRRVLQSMARVGSRVFRQSSMDLDNQLSGVAEYADDNDTNNNDITIDEKNWGQPRDAKKHKILKEHKASTYEHVHEIVEQGIDSCHEINNTSNGHNYNPADRASYMISGKVGLQNLGNTCFMNSSLQCLSNTIPLTDYFLGYDFRGEINHTNFLGTKGALVTSYAQLTKHLWLGSGPSHAPTGFKHDIGRFAPQFAGYEQHDAQELLAFLLDGIHEDLNRVKKRPYIEDEDCDGSNDEGDAITAWSHYLQRNQSIVVDLFQGQLRNTMTCTQCSHVNVKFDPFMYLSLPISEKCNSLDDCLDLFCEEEYMSGDEQWYCTKCKTHVDATKKIDLFMLPPILIIHLKRFSFSSTGRKSKIDKSIQYPLADWNLSSKKKSKGGIYPLYDLYAVSHHKGNVGFGHYTAHAKNRFDGEWYNFNDSSCNPIDPVKEQKNSGSSAYCLFYNRVERIQQANGQQIEKKTIIRRQSVSRPELWPHLQRNKAAEWKSVRENDFVWDDKNGEDQGDRNGQRNSMLVKISE